MRKKDKTLIGIRANKEVEKLFKNLAKAHGMYHSSFFEIMLYSFILLKTRYGYDSFKIYKEFESLKDNIIYECEIGGSAIAYREK